METHDKNIFKTYKSVYNKIKLEMKHENYKKKNNIMQLYSVSNVHFLELYY